MSLVGGQICSQYGYISVAVGALTALIPRSLGASRSPLSATLGRRARPAARLAIVLRTPPGAVGSKRERVFSRATAIAPSPDPTRRAGAMFPTGGLRGLRPSRARAELSCHLLLFRAASIMNLAGIILRFRPVASAPRTQRVRQVTLSNHQVDRSHASHHGRLHFRVRRSAAASSRRGLL
jgi:hypothetical protein